MVTVLWILYDILVVWRTSLLERTLTRREKGVLLCLGIVVAIYGGYSERQDSRIQADIKQTLQMVAQRVGVSPGTAPTQLGEATIKQIDLLKARISELENQQWPSLKSDVIIKLAADLSINGTHRIEVHRCGTPDCDVFAEGLNKAFQKANWSQVPVPSYPLMWKAPPGIVISGYGDDSGTAALHDAMKDVFTIEVPVLRYAADTHGERITLTIGSKPLDLRVTE